MRESQLLTWAAAAIGAQVFDVQPLHGDQGPWRLSVEAGGQRSDYVLRAPTLRIDSAQIATGAAALQVASAHGLPAPRLVDADLRGENAGVPATLETMVSGTSVWPVGTPDSLRAAGAALFRLHAVAMVPREHLPFRPRPIAVDDFAADRRTGPIPSTPLLDQADAAVTAHGVPVEKSAFLHGDVWPGNLIWSDGHLAAFVDWKTAGVGAPGVDLSELRKQVAITFDPAAPAHVLVGWQQAAGHAAAHVAYWDAVAALNTPTFLYGPEATRRRDAFLEEALQRIG